MSRVFATFLLVFSSIIAADIEPLWQGGIYPFGRSQRDTTDTLDTRLQLPCELLRIECLTESWSCRAALYGLI